MFVFSWLWNEVLYRPIYNILIALVNVVPGHNLGWAIVLFTLIVRVALFVPTYKSLKQQKSMQELQPKLKALKEQHKGDQKRLAEETMALYKAHGVHPCGSCLPILIQLPILFAVFSVLRSGLSPDNLHFLYPFLSNFDLSTVGTSFFWIADLAKPEKYVLPVVTGIAQFYSMWLMQKKQAKKVHDITPHAKNEPNVVKDMETASKMMIYIMPVMVAYFAIQYPAGLALYWAMTTIFSIGQQFILNKRSAELHKD